MPPGTCASLLHSSMMDIAAAPRSAIKRTAKEKESLVVGKDQDLKETLDDHPTEVHSFDELAKGIADGTSSRGQVLKFVGAAILGSVLSSALPEVAVAKKKKKHPPLPTGCSTANPTGSCPTGQTCVNGACCPSADVCGSGASTTCCASGKTCLSNGTCAQQCTQPSDPQCCNSCCLPWEANPSIGFCSAICEGFPSSCGTSGDNACPTGQFCNQFGFCTPVC